MNIEKIDSKEMSKLVQRELDLFGNIIKTWQLCNVSIEEQLLFKKYFDRYFSSFKKQHKEIYKTALINIKSIKIKSNFNHKL